jgi:hypothetical protein
MTRTFAYTEPSGAYGFYSVLPTGEIEWDSLHVPLLGFVVLGNETTSEWDDNREAAEDAFNRIDAIVKAEFEIVEDFEIEYCAGLKDAAYARDFMHWKNGTF